MSAPKVMTVYGTRPEAIKVAPVIKALEADERFTSIAVTTGQHREMLDQVNAQFGITPDHDLDIMRPGQTLNGIVARAIEGLDTIIEQEQPDIIISQGDTSTAMAAAIAGFNRGVKIVHLEAGLRTGNILSPFPEEANRRIIGQVAALHLAPTQESKRNLQREDFRSADIVVAGNSVIDALLEATSWNTTFSDERLQAAADSDAKIVLFTTHRRENLDAMANIGRAMRRLSEDYPDIVFVLPAHLNPKVRAAVFPEIEGRDNILVTDPLPYNEFTKLMARAHIVLTDSGGVQEEAPALGKPVLVMRENTERPEAVTAGTVRLIGTEEDRIVSEAKILLDTPAAYEAMANAVNPYGDGKAAARTVAAIAQLLGIGERLPDFASV
ncbi:non-hydrolyzing UDP-N-acetylglucosamine 2-epimerase [Corynebacterium epidermidicanis]|uniref:UDP-N-acetylglucosamine 2-epimerase (non-hydrolyzing) n=1 Tax=Corynebacterium epidermidicanis TaxID=1050174 RepID=A0A0G3GPC6_9CORY|nr:UDP-N-acetylglucosamine 2-epimerase (non-hydrolyzing) [Corynebacterium epidermidicanis]AKK02425.1 UDP-N-acetylglucosamine 2-epimerase [Corynebacterium epidermidicanis]